MADKEQILRRYNEAVERIQNFHIRNIGDNPGPCCLISTTYPGVWLEHAFDGVCYGRLFGGEVGKQVAKNQMLLFLRNQREDGRLPFRVLDPSLIRGNSDHRKAVGYNQIQECVSFGRLCLEAYELCGDRDFLQEAYERLTRWDEWLCANRMTSHQGLIELFCLFDTGHDNSARFSDVDNQCPDDYGTVPVQGDMLPILASDLNAVFFGDRMALSDMARMLGRVDEALLWQQRAEAVRSKMFELLYDKDDAFFYDVDAKGQKRKFLSIAISNVFTEKVLTQGEFDVIYNRHMKNPEEFWTAWPFPSMAVNSECIRNHAPSNCWGYFSQALTALRCQRWMDDYGAGRDYDVLLEKWVDRLATAQRPFTQEIDPLTGHMTDCSVYYSSAMLLYIYAVRRLGYIEDTD